MKPLIITLVGEDKPGLLGNLANIVFEHNGNWLASNFAHMANQFAGFVEVHIPADKEQDLTQALIAQPDVQVTVNPGSQAQASTFKVAAISLIGNDKPGIVQEIAQAIRNLHLNIEEFESLCESAASSGTTMFKANVQVKIPNDFNLDTLQEAVETVANDLMVDIELQ